VQACNSVHEPCAIPSPARRHVGFSFPIRVDAAWQHVAGLKRDPTRNREAFGRPSCQTHKEWLATPHGVASHPRSYGPWMDDSARDGKQESSRSFRCKGNPVETRAWNLKNHHAERGGFLGGPSRSLTRRPGLRKRPRCDGHRFVVAKIPFRRKRNEHDSIRPIGKVFSRAENRAGREREKSCRAETGTRFVVPPCNPPGVASRHPMMVAVSIQVFRHPSTGPFTTAVQPGHGRWYRGC
jgi:hypothetical protein